ncbi:MAG: branched-chain amino acid aminotransferase [Rhodospirillaceae bacterium]
MDTLTYSRGAWFVGNPPLLGPHAHSVWLGSAVFDGARAIGGCAPDLALHCERVVRSARVMGLDPVLTGPEITELAWDGISRFPAKAHLYICPLFYADGGFVIPDPATTQFALTVTVSPVPEPTGFAATVSSFRRPAADMAPTGAKAACLYPNVARGYREALQKGFDIGVSLDPDGMVAEFSFTNLFCAKGGVVFTPAINGTFLNGITRQRVIQLLRDDGMTVEEIPLSVQDVKSADEVFASGNYQKVGWCRRIDEVDFAKGPVYERARALYWDFARSECSR